jgi:hypothetical protein
VVTVPFAALVCAPVCAPDGNTAGAVVSALLEAAVDATVLLSLLLSFVLLPFVPSSDDGAAAVDATVLLSLLLSFVLLPFVPSSDDGAAATEVSIVEGSSGVAEVLCVSGASTAVVSVTASAVVVFCSTTVAGGPGAPVNPDDQHDKYEAV